MRSAFRRMRSVALVAIAIGWPAPGASAADPGDLFTVDRRPVRRAVVTSGDAFRDDMLTGSEMLERLEGVLCELDARGIAALRRAARRAVVELPPTTRIGVVHLLAGETSRRVEVSFAPSGALFARDLDDPETEPARLDPKLMGELMLEWRAPVPAPGADPGAVERRPSRVILTDAVVTQRYLGRGRSRASSRLPAMSRSLDEEVFRIRLPAGHDPSRPAGVLVWISPTHDPWMPGVSRLFSDVLDERGVILVTADNNGNERPILDRLQVAMDALETVRHAYLIDDERVYVTGMSGGGRSASILVCTFPEMFCGAVPIVGLNSWHVVRLPDDRHIPQQFAKARRDRLRLVKSRRIRSITGDEDFNAFEMRERTRMLAEDGLDIVLDDYPGMGHDMPTPEQFAKALRWVDDPRAEALAAQAEHAADLLRAHIETHGQGPPASGEATESLVEITRAGAWTDAGWQAAAWLGHTRPRPAAP